MAPRRFILVLAALSLFACKRKPDATALDKNDGQGKTHECKLVAGGHITVDTTIKAGCAVTVDEPYTITNNATLKVEPGAKLVFKKGARLEVLDGALMAQGRPTEPIVFTSAEATPAAGDWGGLVFRASKLSLLEDVVVEWAGEEPKPVVGDAGTSKAAALAAAKSYGIIGLLSGGRVGSLTPLADRRPGLYLDEGALVSLAGVSIRHSAKVGIASEGDKPFERFERVTLSDNGGYAMDVPAAVLGTIPTLTANEPVRVRGAVNTTQTWPKVDVVVASLEIVATEKGGAVVLTLAPESVVRIEPKTSIRVGGFAEGGGVVANKVLFTSAAAKPAPGDWAGIVFQKRAPGTNLDGCVIEYAGYDDPPPPPKPAPVKPTSKKAPKPRPKPAALLIEEWMKDFAIVHTTFRNNAGPGMGKSSSYFGFGMSFGTGGCEGLDAPKNDNKSIGQPLCEYHEDELGGLFGAGAFDSALSKVGTDTLMGGEVGGVIGGPGSGYGGLGSAGKGSGGGFGSGGLGAGAAGKGGGLGEIGGGGGSVKAGGGTK